MLGSTDVNSHAEESSSAWQFTNMQSGSYMSAECDGKDGFNNWGKCCFNFLTVEVSQSLLFPFREVRLFYNYEELSYRDE